MDQFTDAQKDACARISEIMREHFDTGVFVVTAFGDNNKDTDVSQIGWHGGFSSVLGNLNLGLLRINASETARWIKKNSEE